MSFSEKLKYARESKNLSQQDLAEILNITAGTVSNYEKDVAFPRWDKILKLCDILDVDPNYLFWDDLSDKIKERIKKQFDSSTNNKYNYLNDHGRSKADEYIQDLAENPKYIKPTKTLASSLSDFDTAIDVTNIALQNTTNKV